MGNGERKKIPIFSEHMENFEKFSQIYRGKVRRLKDEGKKVVCWYGSYVPQELIQASGVVQYPLFDGGDPEPVDAALPYLPFCTNVQARYQVGQYVMKLNPILSIADRIIIDAKEADSVRVGSVFEYLGLPVMYLGVPQDCEKAMAFDYYKRQICKLKKELTKLTGEEITNENLRETIKKYNRVRELLSAIGSLRKENPPVIGGEDVIRLNHYALRCDLDNAISNLEKIYEVLKKEKSKFSEDALRIMVVSRGFAFGDYILLRILEEAGGVVVTEFLDEGTIHPWKVTVDGGDPIENIAEKYYKLRIPSCLFCPSWSKRWQYVSELINEYHVDSLVYYLLAFDIIYDYEYSIFAKRADEKNIPFVMIESAYDFSREATELLRTRVESFVKIYKR